MCNLQKFCVVPTERIYVFCIHLITKSPFLRPFFTSICFNAPYQFTPLYNVRCHIFGLTPFGWLRCSTLTPCFFSDFNIIFGLCPIF